MGFEDIRSLMGSELSANDKGQMLPNFRQTKPPDDPGNCENGNNHGTIVAETVMDIAPEGCLLYIAVPISKGDMRNAVDLDDLGRRLGY